MIVPFSIMFDCGFNVPRGSDALRAIVFRATCFLPIGIVSSQYFFLILLSAFSCQCVVECLCGCSHLQKEFHWYGCVVHFADDKVFY